MAKRRRKKRQGQRMAYFIQRKSEIEGDDTQFFHDDGRRVFFEKIAWTSVLMAQFSPEQEAKVVRGPVQEGDLDYREWLVDFLPESVEVDEYLAAIEETARRSRRPRRR